MDVEMLKNLDKAIIKNDFKQVENIQNKIKEEYKRFECILSEKDTVPYLTLSKEGTVMVLNDLQMKEVLHQLEICEALDWNLPF